MDEAAIAERVRDAIPDAEADVSTPRDPDDDKHFAIDVVSPAFEGEPLVDRHQRVHDALDDALTDSIHAIEVTAETPSERQA